MVELSGGVGGARLARGLAAIESVDLTLVVNVGDDERIHGLHVSPDIDTVTYTLAGVEGPEGWGRAGDTLRANQELGRLGVDNRFLLGDLDIGLHLARTERLAWGEPLSSVTASVAAAFGIRASIFPVTDDPLRTRIGLGDGTSLSFQDYFVHRRHQDEVASIEFEGAGTATPAPGVLEAIEDADVILVAPSNPPLSVWPILAVPGVTESVKAHGRVVAISPLIGGKALKGPAARVLVSLGHSPGNLGVTEAYEGVIDELVIHTDDGADARAITGVDVTVEDTLIGTGEAAARLGRAILGL